MTDVCSWGLAEAADSLFPSVHTVCSSQVSPCMGGLAARMAEEQVRVERLDKEGKPAALLLWSAQGTPPAPRLQVPASSILLLRNALPDSMLWVSVGLSTLVLC